MREPTSGVSFDEQLDEQGPRTKQQTSKHMESHDDNVVSRTKVSGSGFQAVKNRFNGHGDEEEEVNVEKPEWNNDTHDRKELKLSPEEMNKKKARMVSKNLDKAKVDLYFQSKEEQWNKKMKTLTALKKQLSIDQANLRQEATEIHQQQLTLKALEKTMAKQSQETLNTREHAAAQQLIVENRLQFIHEAEKKSQEMLLSQEERTENLEQREFVVAQKDQENQHARDRLHDQAKHLEHKERLVNMKEQELVELQNRVAQDKRQWQMSQKAQQTQLEEAKQKLEQEYKSKWALESTKLQNERAQMEKNQNQLQCSIQSRWAELEERELMCVHREKTMSKTARDLAERTDRLSLSSKQYQVKEAQLLQERRRIEEIEKNCKSRELLGQVFAAEVEAQNQLNREKASELQALEARLLNECT